MSSTDARPHPAAVRGLFASAHTPFNADGRFNGSTVLRQYELFRDAGVNGVFVCGIEGEGHSLSVAERRAVLETWVGVLEGELPLIAHVGHSSLRDAVRLAEHAGKAGATALAAMAPAYFPPATLEELIEYLAAIAAAAPDLPFLFYDVPDRNGVCFPTEQVLEWGRLRIPNLAGVNLGSPDLKTFARCQQLEGDFDVLAGNEESWLPSLALGARAAVGGTLGFAAPVYRRIEEAFVGGDIDRARAEHAKTLQLGRALQEFGTVRAGKALASMLGVDCGVVRLPLRSLHDREFRELHGRLRGLDIFARSLSPPAELGR